MPPDTETLHGNLSPDAYEAWKRFAATSGVTMSALLEAIGLRLNTAELKHALTSAVSDARTITAERRARR